MKKNLLLAFTWAIFACYTINGDAQTGSWKLAGNNLAGTEKLGSLNNFDLTVVTNNITRMTVKGNGRMGIGTSSPEGNLHIFRGSAGTVTANANSPLIIENSTNNYISLLAPSNRQRGIFFGDNLSPEDGGLLYDSSNKMLFQTNGNVTKMVLTGTGNLGIGTTAPNVKLHIAGGTPADESSGGYIVTGSLNGKNVVIDDNSIFGRNNGSWAPFYINSSRTYINDVGGQVLIGGSGPGSIRVGIGTNSPAYTLSVNGTIQSKEVRVETGWADYVFDKNYKLRSLENVAEYIAQNKRLPGMPSAKEIQKNGLAVGEVQTRMMEKIEELTLYIIDLQKQINELKNRN